MQGCKARAPSCHESLRPAFTCFPVRELNLHTFGRRVTKFTLQWLHLFISLFLLTTATPANYLEQFKSLIDGAGFNLALLVASLFLVLAGTVPSQTSPQTSHAEYPPSTPRSHRYHKNIHSFAMDDGTCTAPSGEQYYSFGLSPKTVTLVVVPIIACIPAFVIWGIPAIWAWIGVFLGGYVRRKTDGRRGQVLKCIEEDEKGYAAKKKTTSSGDTQKGEGNTSGRDSTPNSSQESAFDINTMADNWAGVIGFFHPFWYAFKAKLHSSYTITN